MDLFATPVKKAGTNHITTDNNIEECGFENLKEVHLILKYTITLG